MEIATAAAALLGPYLMKVGQTVAEKAGQAAWTKLTQLYELVRNKLDKDGDDYAKNTLERLKEKPVDEGRQNALATVLSDKAAADPDFAKQLRNLVERATQTKTLTSF